MSKTCKFKGCDRPIRAKGLCNSHYKQKVAGKKLSPLGGPGRRKKEAAPAPEGPPGPPVPIGDPYPLWPGEQCGVSQELWDMKAVWNQHEFHDKTNAQRELRAALKEKGGRLRYLETMAKAQESYEKNRRKGIGGGEEEVIDMGTETALELVNKLIAEYSKPKGGG